MSRLEMLPTCLAPSGRAVHPDWQVGGRWQAMVRREMMTWGRLERYEGCAFDVFPDQAGGRKAGFVKVDRGTPGSRRSAGR